MTGKNKTVSQEPEMNRAARKQPVRRTDEEIDEALRQSFPASDPPAWTLGTDHREVKKNTLPGRKTTTGK